MQSDDTKELADKLEGMLHFGCVCNCLLGLVLHLIVCFADFPSCFLPINT